jgi:hypothetical protein
VCVCGIERDELANYRNQLTQARRSIHTDINRNLRQCSDIRDSESRKYIGFENCSLNMHIGTYVSRQKPPEMQGRCTARSGAQARALVAEAFPEMHAQYFEALTRMSTALVTTCISCTWSSDLHFFPQDTFFTRSARAAAARR